MAALTTDDAREAIQGWFEDAAWWRSQKADQFPDDDRNMHAVASADGLIATVAAVPDALLQRLVQAWPDDGCDNHYAIEIMSEMKRSLGFHADWENATSFVEDFLSQLDQARRGT